MPDSAVRNRPAAIDSLHGSSGVTHLSSTDQPKPHRRIGANRGCCSARRSSRGCDKG